MIIHHYDYVIHPPLITLSLSKLYFYISFLFYFILCLSIHENTIQNINELTFTIKEELPIGTIIASNIQLGNLFLHFNHYGNIENMTNIIKILNQKDPGINCFHFQWLPLESLNDSNRNQLQLIINNRIDREILCPIKTHELRNNNNNNMNDPNHLDLDHINDLQSINSDCIITLRIALFINNLQKIYQIHIYIEDINDNPPKWNMNNLTIYFHDEDPPGTKQSILLAYDIDIDINAKITYQLLNNDIYSYQLNDRNYNHNNNDNLNLRGTDIFELVQETLNHERLYLKTRYTLDRELKPYGWNLILLAINNDSLIQLSSQLLLHIHLIDINDNSPIFTQTLYKPQLPNQKIGIIPENYPINKTILKVSATDRDEGENAQLTYHLALDTTNNQLLCHFFNLTQNGELYLIQSLNVDRITQINSTRLYLPISMINLDVIVIDGAMIPYSKTGSTTIQLQIENIDDEPPEIYIHPIQSLKQHHHHHHQQQQQDDHSILHNHRFYETEIGVYENQTIGQLIALIEVKDPDDLMNPTSIQCRLIGSNSNDFYLSYHNSINNEYQLYTNTILDREIQSKLLVSIECKDLANHITLHNLIIHILDINDHQPQCMKSHYYYSLYEDDNEQEDQDDPDPDPDHGVNYRLDKTMKNRTWLTSNGLAYILATDNDIGINSQLIYELSNESIEHFNYKFTIHSNTGQLLAWGPFDRESISIYELSIIVKDNGYPIQLSTNCLVTINILDINDNIPIFHPQLNILGGYLFHIKENQLPGTYIGQIQAYDLDDLPPSIDITQLFHEYDQSNSLLVLSSSSSNIHNVNNDELKGILSSIDKKLTYSLKNEYHSQMFRIDPKTGVIITRTILDREIQGTYTFYAYVHDGPDKPIQITNTTVNKTEIQRTINNYRSHTASIMITITIQDENDNDPVFIRPNSTNHMILLNPTAIPGQSLSQLLAIDPDEGLNGQVSYAIKGETAGILFNVDPRTGLLYLESQIPRQYITNNKQKTTINNQGNDLNYPTFLLGLDACDHGEPRRCTHFPNLQIQIRSSSNIIDEGKSNEYRQTDLSINQQIDDIFMSQSSHGSLSSSSSSSSSYGSGTSTTYLGRYSLGEILIIGLSIFFSILILIILFIICIVRRRTQRILQNNERINPELLKLNQGNAGFNVESNEKNKRTKPRVKLSNSNTNKNNTTIKKSFLLRLLTRQLNKNRTMNMDHAHVNTTSSTSVLPISCNLSINNSNPLSISSTSVLSSSTGQMMNPFRLNYSVDMMNSRLYNPNIHHSINYGPYSPICVNTTNNIPVISDDYQSLNCWNDLPVYYSNQLKQDNITNSNIPQLYMKQLKQPVNAQNSNLDINNNNNNITSPSSPPTTTTTTTGLSSLPIVLHNKQSDSNWILHNTHLLMNNNNNNNNNNIKNNGILSNDLNNHSLLNQQNICKTNGNSQAYTGLMKSSFV